MEIREAPSLASQLVQIWGLENWVAMRRDISKALVVGKDKQNVRLFARLDGCLRSPCEQQGSEHEGEEDADHRCGLRG